MLDQSCDKDMLLIHKICILIISVTLLLQYLCTSEYEIVIENPKFSLNGPYNTSDNFTLDDTYDQLIDLNTFKFKVNPQPCQDYENGLLLLIIISSNPINYENRMLIRNTWGSPHDSMKVVFLLGDTQHVNLSKKISAEMLQFGDIIQGNFIDSYRNMTYKHVMGLKWAYHYCSSARYVLKTDDDVLVNIQELRRFLIRELSPWGARNLITCEVLTKPLVQRYNSKWIVSVDEYPSTYYPTYCAGWVILYSQDVVYKLLKAAQSSSYFWIDDVQITGILAEQIKIERTPINKYILSEYNAQVLAQLGPAYVSTFIFGPPNLSQKRILNMWNAIQQ